MDPFTFWTEAWRTGLKSMSNAALIGELVVHSASVIERRAHVLTAACRDPATADHRELHRMVSEKQEAFRHARLRAGRDLARLQADVTRQWIEIGRAFATVPTFGAGADIAARQMEIAARAALALEKVILPYHQRAGANARRLARRRPKPRQS